MMLLLMTMPVTLMRIAQVVIIVMVMLAVVVVVVMILILIFMLMMTGIIIAIRITMMMTMVVMMMTMVVMMTILMVTRMWLLLQLSRGDASLVVDVAALVPPLTAMLKRTIDHVLPASIRVPANLWKGSCLSMSLLMSVVMIRLRVQADRVEANVVQVTGSCGVHRSRC